MSSKKNGYANGLMAVDPVNVKALPFTLVDDCDGCKLLVSERYETGELAYYFVIKSMLGTDIGSAEEWPTHVLELLIVSPTYLHKKELMQVWESCGYGDPYDCPVRTDVDLVAMIVGYGHAARIAEVGGGNFTQLYKRLAKEASVCQSMFGFYLDRAANRVGNSGWDFMRGDIGRWTSRQAQEDAAELKASAELVACFALARGMGPDSEFESYFEDDEDGRAARLLHMASCYVNDWLLDHPYPRRKAKKVA